MSWVEHRFKKFICIRIISGPIQAVTTCVYWILPRWTWSFQQWSWKTYGFHHRGHSCHSERGRRVQKKRWQKVTLEKEDAAEKAMSLFLSPFFLQLSFCSFACHEPLIMEKSVTVRRHPKDYLCHWDSYVITLKALYVPFFLYMACQYLCIYGCNWVQT